MRVTIGERLGIVRFTKQDAVPRHISDDPVYDEAIPEFIQPESVVRLSDAPSSAVVPVEMWDEDTDIAPGPPRVTGHMEWVHKSVPVLVIHGRDTIPPEEYAAMRRR